jgi:hypothetical protein
VHIVRLSDMENHSGKNELKPELADVGHALAKGILSEVPLVGGAASEFFSLYVASPLSRRRDEWIQSLDARLADLEDKMEGFQREDLPRNDMFVTAFLYAVPIAVRSHQEEKTEALRNAVLHAAVRDPPDDDLHLMFLSNIDYLTAWHLRVLKFLEDPGAWIENRLPEGVRPGSHGRALEHAYPELADRREFSHQLARDLHERGLIQTEDLNVMVSTISPLVTEMGRRFLAFISSPC